MARFPISPLGHYMEASPLWPQVRRPATLGVISHASALALHGMTDVSPAKVHITLPAGLRLRRVLPRQFELHFATLGPDDVQRADGVPVTTAERTIRDVHAVAVLELAKRALDASATTAAA